MALQRLEALAVLETDQIFRRHRLLDGNRGLGRLERRLGPAGRNPQQRGMNLADQVRNFGRRRRIVAEIGRNDIRGQFDEALAGGIGHGLNLLCESRYVAACCRTVSGRAYTLRGISVRLDEYERITGELTRTTAFYFSTDRFGGKVLARSGPLVEMRAQFVDRGEPHHAFGHLRLDRAVGIQRIGHAIDDARFEHRHRRLILGSRRRRRDPRGRAVGRGRRSTASGAPLRRDLAGLAPLRFGQASSKDAGGASTGSGGGGAAGGLGRRSGDSRSGGNGSLVRACARSRSFRDDEENNRLRRGLAGCWPASGTAALPAARSRAAASFMPGGARRLRGADGSALPASSAGGWSRSNRQPPSAGARSAQSAALEPAARGFPRAITGIRSQAARWFSVPGPPPRAPSMITPEQAAIAPARISVLPKLNSLYRNAEADRQQARQNKADPGDQHTNHHRTHPRSRARNARRPPMPRYRHIVRIANRQLLRGVPENPLQPAEDHPDVTPSIQLAFRPHPYIYRLLIAADLLHCIRELRHNCQLLGNGTALYGCRGMRLKSAKAGPEGTPGYQ